MALKQLKEQKEREHSEKLKDFEEEQMIVNENIKMQFEEKLAEKDNEIEKLKQEIELMRQHMEQTEAHLKSKL